MNLDYSQKRTWAEIDIDALEYNYKTLRKTTSDKAKICCIIKADAYGHGAVRVARLYEELGADFLAVSNIEEAFTVRRAGVNIPLLILGYTHPQCASALAEYNISQCVYSYEYGKALAQSAKESNVKIPIHLKIDVGMGRLGFVFKNEKSFLDAIEICTEKCFITEGVFTHFPMADEGEMGVDITQKQFDIFCQAVKTLERSGISFDIKHCNNSAATIKFPQFCLDMVRVGVSLYGIVPEGSSDVHLKNTLSLKTVISNIKTIHEGDTVGYGSEYVAKKDTVIATLPIGYADGFKRENFHNGTHVWINGALCPVVGRVCMDQIMVDISSVDVANIGDEVIIYGDKSTIDLNTFSKNNRKIPYETMCEISARVSRVYRKNGSIEYIRDSLV